VDVAASAMRSKRSEWRRGRYVTGVQDGKRIQKFVFKGLTAR
jgi:hypothetical protein